MPNSTAYNAKVHHPKFKVQRPTSSTNTTQSGTTRPYSPHRPRTPFQPPTLPNLNINRLHHIRLTKHPRRLLALAPRPLPPLRLILEHHPPSLPLNISIQRVIVLDIEKRQALTNLTQEPSGPNSRGFWRGRPEAMVAVRAGRSRDFEGVDEACRQGEVYNAQGEEDVD